MARVTFFGPASRADAVTVDPLRVGRNNVYGDGYGYVLRNIQDVNDTLGNYLFGAVSGQTVVLPSGFVRFYVRLRTLPTLEKGFCNGGHTVTANPGFYMTITTAGNLRFYNGHTVSPGALIFTSPTPLTVSTTLWNKIEFYFQMSTSVANTGFLVFKINGVTVYSGTISDAGEGMNRVGDCDNIVFNPAGGDVVTASGMDMDISNFSVDTGDFPEDTQVTQILPNGTGFYNNWTGLNPDARNRLISYGVVAGSSGGVEDVSTTLLSTRHSYTLPSFTSMGITGNILGVRVVGRLGLGVATTGILFIRRNGVDIDAGGTFTYAVAATNFVWAHFNTVGWSTSDVIEIGFRSGGSAGTYRFKEISLVVEHDTPFVSPPLQNFTIQKTNYTGTGALQTVTLPNDPDFVMIWPRTGTVRGAIWCKGCYTFKRSDGNAGNTTKAALINGTSLNLYDADTSFNVGGTVYDVLCIRDPQNRVIANGSFFYDNNVDNVPIPVRFDPTLVNILSESDGTNLGLDDYYLFGPTQATGNSILWAALALQTGRIESLGTLSFIIRTGLLSVVNVSQWPWFALRPANLISNPIVVIANWTGDGTGARNIPLTLAGQTPYWVMVFPQNNGERYMRNDQMSDSRSMSSAVASAVAITALGVNQISIDSAVNVLGVLYTAIVFVEGVDGGFASNQYSGIYYLDPAVRHDTLWDRSVSPPVTSNVKIPNPIYRTHFVGDG